MMNVLLMGARACGKTTIARELASRLEWRFVDLDDLTLAKFREPTVSQVWSEQGEPAWRQAECKALRETLLHEHQVIALGGGTPMIPEAAAMIQLGRQRHDVKTIYLRCSLETLIQRLQQNAGDRPSITGVAVAAEVGPIVAEREPTYRALADHEIDASHASPTDIAERIIGLVAGEKP